MASILEAGEAKQVEDQAEVRDLQNLEVYTQFKGRVKEIEVYYCMPHQAAQNYDVTAKELAAYAGRTFANGADTKQVVKMMEEPRF
jgi:hypothetical protein